MAVCPNCGKTNPDGFKFCGFCSASLEPASQAQAEERKVVSILFVDLVGFTARSHSADPEDVRAALGPYYALLKREIERFGGTVEKFIGDAVMAVFGAPVAHEDDPERAVRAALRIIEAIAELNQDSTLDLSVRGAVNTGEVLVALGPGLESGEGIVAGDVVNTASRMQNEAPVNGVVVGEITYRTTKDVFDYEELPPVTVKGKPEPLSLWRAVSARSRLGLEIGTPKTPFIGRDFELTTLKLAYQRAVRESSLQLVTIVGEPGVGKSRLLTEFGAFIDEQQELISWRQGRSLPYGEGITFWALGEIIKAQAGILESDPVEQAREKLTAAVNAAIQNESEREWFVARLAPLVGVQVPGGGSSKGESFTAWRRFLEALAERGPLVLAFDDLHWADPSLLDFIDHLVDWATGVPMFVVCTARPELYDKHPNWGGGKRNITVISLSPLNDSETAQLISALLSQAVLPAEIHTALLDRSGGNPLYAEEFVRMLFDRGILHKKGRTLVLSKDEAIPVPESVHALIAARLDTLSSERKTLLQDASVAGKIFWSGAVAAMNDTDVDSTRQGLHELGAKELVRRSRSSSIEGEEEFSFWHGLIRDVCYGQIPRSTRSRKHEAMAVWIEATAERLDDFAELLAYHYATALDLSRAAGSSRNPKLERKAREFLIAAGKRALDLDPAAALARYRQALALVDEVDSDRAEACFGAAMASKALGLVHEGESHYKEAIAGFERAGNVQGEAAALTSFSILLRDSGRPEEGRRCVERALKLLEAEPPSEELSRAYRAMGFYGMIGNDYPRALSFSKRAVDVARDSGSLEALAASLDIQGLIRCESGDLDGLDDLREAARLCEENVLGETQIVTLNNLADRIWLIEGPVRGLEVNRRAQRFGLSHGLVHNARWAQMSSFFMLFEAGEWDATLAEGEELVAWARRHGSTLIEVSGNFFLAQVRFHRGDTAGAAAMEDRFVTDLRDKVDLEEVAPSLALAALKRAAIGDRRGALSFLNEFDQKTARSPIQRARHLPSLARTAVITGELESASRLLASADRTPYPHDRIAQATGHNILAEASGDLERALDGYREAADRWRAFGNVFEEAQALLGAGRCLIGIGSGEEAAPLLRSAEAIFGRLGAKPLLEETLSQLGQATALSL